MSPIRLLIIITLLAGVPGLSSAASVLIGFEELDGGTVVTDQYAGATFSANAGFENEVSHQPGIGFGDNFICTAPIGDSINCSEETLVSFAVPVRNLSFYQVGDNSSGVIALVDVFVDGAFAGTVDIRGDHNFNSPDWVDLTAFENVTGIRIYGIVDVGGLGWDNFRFAELPLPGAVWLLGSGLLGLAGAGRRRKLVR